MRKLALLLVLGLMACKSDTPPTSPTTIIINNNQQQLSGSGGQEPTGATGTAVAVHLGCDQMTGPTGDPLIGCGAALADYTAPAGSSGRLDATPVDANGSKVDGLSVQSWNNAGPCAIEGDTFGTDGFNPTIHIALGECVVTVNVAGLTASRKFIGQ